MESITTLSLDLQKPNHATTMYAVQNDRLTRKISATLVDGSIAWTPPTGSLAVVRFVKPDGTMGFYDTDENDNTAVTWTGNVATIILAEQMLTVAGDVYCQVNFYNSGEERLSTFAWVIKVQKNVITDETIESTDYFNILTHQIDSIIEALANVPIPSTTVPLMDGTASVGSESGYARGNHRHPTDTTRVPTTRTVNGKELSANITIAAGDIGYNSSTSYPASTVGAGLNYLQSRTTEINNSVGSITKKFEDWDIIENFSDLASTTKKYVLVVNNNSDYANNKNVIYQEMPYSENGYLRNNNTYVYAVPDQGELITKYVPISEIRDIMLSYMDNSNIVYGQTNTMFSSTVTNEMSCATFVCAVLQGISYNNSKYVDTDNRANINISTERFTKTLTSPSGLTSRSIARYFAENKRLFTFSSDYRAKQYKELQFGDIIFFSDAETYPTRYYNIRHCAIVISEPLVTTSTYIAIAEVGTTDDTYTQARFGTTTGHFAVIAIDENNLNANYCFKVFARPNYNELLSLFKTVNASDLLQQKFTYKLKNFVPGFYLTTSQGIPAYAKYAGYDPTYYEAMPNAILTYKGTVQDSGSRNYYAVVCEYSNEYKLLARTAFHSSPVTLNSSTKYIRFQFGYSSQYSSPPLTAHTANEFEAELTLQ